MGGNQWTFVDFCENGWNPLSLISLVMGGLWCKVIVGKKAKQGGSWWMFVKMGGISIQF